MRAIFHIMIVGVGVVGVSGCVPAEPYSTGAYRPTPTTTTTVVVRDGYGNPISTTEAVRDVNGNPVNSAGTGGYQ